MTVSLEQGNLGRRELGDARQVLLDVLGERLRAHGDRPGAGDQTHESGAGNEQRQSIHRPILPSAMFD